MLIDRHAMKVYLSFVVQAVPPLAYCSNDDGIGSIHGSYWNLSLEDQLGLQ